MAIALEIELELQHQSFQGLVKTSLDPPLEVLSQEVWVGLGNLHFCKTPRWSETHSEKHCHNRKYNPSSCLSSTTYCLTTGKFLQLGHI